MAGSVLLVKNVFNQEMHAQIVSCEYIGNVCKGLDPTHADHLATFEFIPQKLDRLSQQILPDLIQGLDGIVE